MVVIVTSILEHCINCGKCCKVGSPMVLPSEREAIISKTGKDFFQKYEEAYIIKEEPCPFLQEDKCSIEEIKPIDCKSFPLCFKSERGKMQYFLYKDCPAAKKLSKDFIEEAKQEYKKIPEKFHKLEFEITKKSGFKLVKLA